MSRNSRRTAQLLTLDENVVICLRLGLDRQEPRTVEEVATELGFTRTHIRRLERSAMQKLSTHEGLRVLAEALNVVQSGMVGGGGSRPDGSN